MPLRWRLVSTGRPAAKVSGHLEKRELTRSLFVLCQSAVLQLAKGKGAPNVSENVLLEVHPHVVAGDGCEVLALIVATDGDTSVPTRRRDERRHPLVPSLSQFGNDLGPRLCGWTNLVVGVEYPVLREELTEIGVHVFGEEPSQVDVEQFGCQDRGLVGHRNGVADLLEV